MIALNRAGAEALLALPAGAVRACTDVTGFGLLGHAAEMAAASGCTLRIRAGAVPLIDGARELALANTPGGGHNNEAHFGAGVAVEGRLNPAVFRLLYDPQTSGGLLAAVDPACGKAALDGLRGAGLEAAVIGEAAPAVNSRLVVAP
jgi:selenide,water dikinase